MTIGGIHSPANTEPRCGTGTTLGSRLPCDSSNTNVWCGGSTDGRRSIRNAPPASVWVRNCSKAITCPNNSSWMHGTTVTPTRGTPRSSRTAPTSGTESPSEIGDANRNNGPVRASGQAFGATMPRSERVPAAKAKATAKSVSQARSSDTLNDPSNADTLLRFCTLPSEPNDNRTSDPRLGYPLGSNTKPDSDRVGASGGVAPTRMTSGLLKSLPFDPGTNGALPW